MLSWLCRDDASTLGGVLLLGDEIMADKGFKAIDEQINLLKSRGLQIDDEQQARDFLYRNNYYRISGYSLTLRHHDVFSKHATFQNIMDIYWFDHKFRHILLTYLEIIEVSVKSVYAHEFTKLHGPTDYLDASYFSDQKKHHDIITKAEDQKNARRPHEAYLKHFMDDLHQDIPLWAYVDLLTISDISFLYSISESDLKQTVANAFGLTMSRGPELLGKFMHSMTILRNLCAHGSRLYNRLFEQRPSLNKGELALLRKNPDGTVDNTHLYGFILIMRRLLEEEDFRRMKDEIIALKSEYPFVKMKYYGFRDDWKTAL